MGFDNHRCPMWMPWNGKEDSMGWRSYEELDKSLHGRCISSRKLGNNTYAHRHYGSIVIRFHATDILEFFEDGSVIVDCRGWRSVTTAQRLGEHWPRDAKYRIISLYNNWVWCTHGWESKIEFCDGDKILPNGELELKQSQYRQTIEQIEEAERKRKCERAKKLREANPERYRFNAKCQRTAKRIASKPVDKWKPEDVKYLRNSELRRRVLNHFGWDRVLATMQHEIIHTAKDAKGNDMQLVALSGFAIPETVSSWQRRRSGGVMDVVLLKVICPSTGSFYTLRVPPDITDCELARRWTLHDEQGTLEFLKET